MSQSRANKPDTPADVALRGCLVGPQRRSFTMVAGAGSGKTTSLVKALATIVNTHGDSLKSLRQKVACITYTEIAAQEIWADVGNNRLVHVSTIHSFLWTITRTFQRDIRDWVLRRIDERITELRTDAANFGPRVHQKTRDTNQRKIERLEASREPASKVDIFSYGTGANYAKGILGHDDIIRVATDFLRERPLFRTLLAQQYPFVFVDESQDTQASVIDALKAVDRQLGPKFCLGFFGDPMQRIFVTGGGDINAEDEWLKIEKPENFRCPTSVLSVANAIRRSGDDLVQTGGRNEDVNGVRTPAMGTARIFILPADARRDEFVGKVRDFVALKNQDEGWRDGAPTSVKMLVIVHRMAALRLGFGDLYSAMNDKAPSKFSDGFLEGSAWPLRPFISFILPLLEAAEVRREFDIMALLRKHSPLLTADALREMRLAERLAQLRSATIRLVELMASGSGATVKDVLSLVHQEQLCSIEPGLLSYLEDADEHAGNANVDAVAQEDALNDEEQETELAKEIASMQAFLACPARQFVSYQGYVQQASPFATQQGVKGAEYERVMVILDDEEGNHRQFSYDKYFAVKDPSRDDLKKIEAGEETSVDRTRRLFYVCCTRALSDLVVVYFSTEAELAEAKVRESGIFPEDVIFNEASL